MKIFSDLSQITKDKNTFVTIGTFDGVHLGHQKIIERIETSANQKNCRSFLITFEPHPRKIVSKDSVIKLLTTTEEKLLILKKLKVQNVFLVNFTVEFSQLSADEFVKKYIIDGMGVKEIIIGYDHHFGKDRSGDLKKLTQLGKEFDFSLSMVEEVKINEQVVSSTKIRNALAEGNLLTANSFLGRYYSFSGKVIHGDKRGRTLGYPTANLRIDEDKLLPALGIYLCEVIVNNEKYYGLLSIGRRPTFYSEGEIIPEVFILNFDEDIYDAIITLNLIERIRSEKKFDSVEDLIKQMDEDKKTALKILEKINN
ncbi:MAG TPA: bifunctional riboflavin kinase/FAD synthetase [Ignavibacteriaceae bacterium]|nr:bifunctional riboflavin kinase/FAD synthetase [Ignavibacteriaceae bacterium]